MPVGPNEERLPYPDDEDYGEPPGRRRTRFGGNIPSPQQMTREQAQLRALLEQMGGFSGEPPMQTRTPQEPTFKDIPKMTPEQLEQYNKPMGEGETNPFDMFMQYLRGGR